MFFIRTSIAIASYQLYIMFKSYSTSSRQVVNSINKLMRNTKKRRNFQGSLPLTNVPQILSHDQVQQKKNQNPRRETVLNKLFMKHVTDLLAMGQYSSEMVGNGIQISKVNVTPDYKFLKIYWFCKEQADDVLVAKLLNKNAGYLEHELSQLRVMGKIPTMQFVKDKYYMSIGEVDKRLAIADFGDDHVPQDLTLKLKTEFEILHSLEDHIKEQLVKLESENSDEHCEPPLPLMTHNIFGVDYSAILARVKQSMKKSTAAHRNRSYNEDINTNWVKFKVTQPINENPVHFGKNESQSVTFKEFLQKHQLQKLKSQENRYTYKMDRMQEDIQEFYDDADNENQEDFIIEEEIDNEYKW